MNELKSYRVGRYDASPCDPDAIDPRGILWLWEEPLPRAEYVLGVDPTVGLTGWHRALRTRDDTKTDNAVVEVFRCGTPDVQVAEWAGPVDAVELADVVNFLGKMYAGSNEDGMALAAIEVYPGPGWMTQRELINRFGYTNLPPWLQESGVAMRITQKIGWFSTRSTRRDLWVRGINHLTNHKAIIRSPWLVEEMADCTPDNFLAATGRAMYGRHDDRVVATLLALWYANEWSLAIEPTERNVMEKLEAPDWQRSDITLDAMVDEWEDRFQSLLEE